MGNGHSALQLTTCAEAVTRWTNQDNSLCNCNCYYFTVSYICALMHNGSLDSASAELIGTKNQFRFPWVTAISSIKCDVIAEFGCFWVSLENSPCQRFTIPPKNESHAVWVSAVAAWETGRLFCGWHCHVMVSSPFIGMHESSNRTVHNSMKNCEIPGQLVGQT